MADDEFQSSQRPRSGSYLEAARRGLNPSDMDQSSSQASTERINTSFGDRHETKTKDVVIEMDAKDSSTTEASLTIDSHYGGDFPVSTTSRSFKNVEFEPVEPEISNVKFIFPKTKFALAIFLTCCGAGFLIAGLVTLSLAMICIGGICILPGTYQLYIIIKTWRNPTREAIQRNYELVEID